MIKKYINRRGFTLIELLIVILMVSLLTTVGVIAYMQQQKKVRDSRRKTDLQTIMTALEIYRNDPTNPGAPAAEVATHITNPGYQSYIYFSVIKPFNYLTDPTRFASTIWGDNSNSITSLYFNNMPEDPRMPKNVYNESTYTHYFYRGFYATLDINRQFYAENYKLYSCLEASLQDMKDDGGIAPSSGILTNFYEVGSKISSPTTATEAILMKQLPTRGLCPY